MNRDDVTLDDLMAGLAAEVREVGPHQRAGPAGRLARTVPGAGPADRCPGRAGTVTGKNLALPKGIPPPGEQKPAVYPLAGGQLLIRVPQGETHRLYLVAADGTIRDRATEPTRLARSALLLTPGLG